MRCQHCGRTAGYDHIPPDLRAMGEAAGLPKPIWYAGPLLCPRYQRKKTLSDLARESRLRVEAYEARNAASTENQSQKGNEAS